MALAIPENIREFLRLMGRQGGRARAEVQQGETRRVGKAGWKAEGRIYQVEKAGQTDRLD